MVFGKFSRKSEKERIKFQSTPPFNKLQQASGKFSDLQKSATTFGDDSNLKGNSAISRKLRHFSMIIRKLQQTSTKQSYLQKNQRISAKLCELQQGTADVSGGNVPITSILASYY